MATKSFITEYTYSPKQAVKLANALNSKQTIVSANQPVLFLLKHNISTI